MLPACSTTNSNSQPISALNSFRSKYHCRISFTSVSAVQTRPTRASKMRSTMIASAESLVLVIMFAHFAFVSGSMIPKTSFSRPGHAAVDSRLIVGSGCNLTNSNRLSIPSLAARRKGIARYAALHLDYARSAWPAGRYRFTVGTVVVLPLNRKARIDIRSCASFLFR